MTGSSIAVVALFAGSLLPWEAVRAQEEPPALTAIAVHPGPAPVPALKYRILPERDTTVPGNAAVFYHRAIEWWLERRGRADDGVTAEWIRCAAEAIPLDRARQWLDDNRRVLHEVELGARRQDCDWEFESRPEGYELVIGEIQWMRTLARLVALRARIAVLDKKPDEAIYWLQTGYAMGRHVAEGPLLIQTLVGVACCSLMTKPMEDLIQAPGTPSLCWALAGRPRPFIDMSRALDNERLLPEREVPRLRRLDGVAWSAEEGRAFAHEVETRLYQYAGWYATGPFAWGAPASRDWINRVGLAALAAQAYPASKRALIARGRSPAQVEAMPAIQAVFLDVYIDYQERRDELFKWANVPANQAFDRMTKTALISPEVRRKPLLDLLCTLVVSFQGATLGQARLDRQLDALQCIEAIRLHAASHGHLPARLEDVDETPIPLDPMTGRPFEYRVEGNHGFLSAPNVPATYQHSSFGLHYELTLTP